MPASPISNKRKPGRGRRRVHKSAALRLMPWPRADGCYASFENFRAGIEANISCLKRALAWIAVRGEGSLIPILRLVVGRRLQSRAVRQASPALTNITCMHSTPSTANGFPTPIVLASSMFDVSSRAKLSVSASRAQKSRPHDPGNTACFFERKKKCCFMDRH